MQTWATIEQAAATLGVSARTVQRRLAAGDLQSRTGDDGRREVLIDDTPPAARPTPVGELGEVVIEQHDRALALAERSAHVGQLAVDRVAGEARAARRMLGIVGVALAVIVSVAGVGGVWAAWRIGGAETRLELADATRADVEADRDALAAKLADTVADADRQREQAERALAERDTVAATLAEVRAQLAAERERARELGALLLEVVERPPDGVVTGP